MAVSAHIESFDYMLTTSLRKACAVSIIRIPIVMQAVDDVR